MISDRPHKSVNIHFSTDMISTDMILRTPYIILVTR